MNVEMLSRIVRDQARHGAELEGGIARDHEASFDAWLAHREVVILMGVRRSGKSYLLQKLRRHAPEGDYYLNFEDDRLVGFCLADCELLLEAFLGCFGEQHTFYFDEIQNVDGWERFVRRLYDQGCKVVITGSNARLLSGELGTVLTGRYLPVEVYPLSFPEWCHARYPELRQESRTRKERVLSQNAVLEYMQEGGFPGHMMQQDPLYLQTVYQGILYRDLVVRYRLSRETVMRELVFWLASNTGKTLTYNALKKTLGVGSVTTVADYCGYLEAAYLCFFLTRYSRSLKQQLASPKKVYWVDTAMAQAIGFRFSEDRDRLYENLVILQLKRMGCQVYYHQAKKECDFVVVQGREVQAIIQVTVHVDHDSTWQREVQGLLEAAQAYGLAEGLMLTEATHEDRVVEGIGIKLRPIGWWLMQPHHSSGRASKSVPSSASNA